MPYISKTLLMQLNTGKVVDLGQDCGKVTITTKGDCYAAVAPPGTAPSTPTDPAPAAGAVADYIHLAASGDTVTWGVDFEGKGMVPGLQEPIRYVKVYGKAAADLLIVGH